MNHLGSPNELVVVIVLNWNNYADTAECLDSVLNSDSETFELKIVVVDNGSTDGSCERLVRVSSHLSLLQTGENLGFARGNNVGIRYAVELGADYVLLLNHDIVVQDSYVRTLFTFMEEDPRVGIVGGKVLYADRPNVIWAAGGKIDWWRGRFPGYGFRQANTDDAFATVREVDHIPAAAMMIRRRMLDDIGLLPECYFLGGEEADFAVKARRAGYKVIYVPDREAYVWHKVGYSGIRSLAYQYNRARNRLLFLQRNLPKLVWYMILARESLFWKWGCLVLQHISQKVRRSRRVMLLAMEDHKKTQEIRGEHLAKAASILAELA